MAAVEGLPEELMALILSKLPVKSLVRLKCVQKSWYFFINSPYFIHLHRSSSSSSNQCLIFRRYYRSRHVLSVYSYETLDDLGNHIDLPFPNADGVSLSGSCDGLVCLTKNNNQILICNPMLQEFRSLVLPRCLFDSVAFGSDPNTGQYKVLMVGAPRNYDYEDDDDDDDDDYVYNGLVLDDREARLYDFSTDTWRKTAAVIPPGPFRYKQRAISLNGAFHWCPGVGCDSNDILTFHMSNEVSGFVPLPDFVVNVCEEKELFVSRKSQLSLVFDSFGQNWGWFEICVMTEYGVKESWTRLFKIGPLPQKTVRPIGLWGEQQLLLKFPEGQLVSCDLQHPNLRRLPIHPIYGYCDVYPFSQSLVSVNSLNQAPFVVL